MGDKDWRDDWVTKLLNWGYVICFPICFAALIVAGITDALAAKIVMATAGTIPVALLGLAVVVEVWRDHKELRAKRAGEAT